MGKVVRTAEKGEKKECHLHVVLYYGRGLTAEPQKGSKPVSVHEGLVLEH